MSNLEIVLAPYRKECRYLQDAKLRIITNKDDDLLFLADGRFSIPESCYINKTGHFNSVEFNICFNQLAYFLLYECILTRCLPELNAWSIEDFVKNQLSSMLILKFSCNFVKQMNSLQFDGFLQIAKITRSENWLRFTLLCSFTDGTGHSNGKISCVIPKYPQISSKL